MYRFMCILGVLGVSTSIISINAANATNVQQDQKLAQKIFETIENKGQAELCKEGGLFRGSATKDGSIMKGFGTPGGNCDRNPVFAQIALATCSGVADFDKSSCSIKARRVLGGMLVPRIIEDIKASIKAGNGVLKTVVCQPFKEKLTGGLAQAEVACSVAPARPTAALPKQQVRASIKNNLDWIDALEAEVAALDAAKPAAKRKITVGSKEITLPAINPKNKSALLVEIKKIKNNLRKVDQSVTDGPAVVPAAKAEKVESYVEALEKARNDQDLLDILTDEEKKLLGF
jgi:hypothetical protein